MNPFVIRRPVITEKSLLLANTQNTYTFEVARSATKKQIQEMIQNLYNVEVTSVNTVFGYTSMVPRGRKRLKRITSKVKKAFVKLKAGQTITLFDLSGGAQA